MVNNTNSINTITVKRELVALNDRQCKELARIITDSMLDDQHEIIQHDIDSSREAEITYEIERYKDLYLLLAKQHRLGYSYNHNSELSSLETELEKLKEIYILSVAKASAQGDGYTDTIDYSSIEEIIGEFGISRNDTTGKYITPYLLKEREPSLAKKLSIDNKPHEFKQSAKDILNAIIYDKEIDGLRIADKIQNPNFRFTSKINSELSASDLSEVIAAVVSRSHLTDAKKLADKASEKRSERADDYASEMYQVIQDIKSEAGVSTFRATVDLLTKKGVETPSGGTNWHISTLQDLQKRWKKLGFIASTPKTQ